MKFTLTILLILLLIGCGSRKAEIDRLKASVEAQRELMMRFKNDIQSNVKLHKIATRTTAEPIDSSKPSTFNGTSFKNARITIDEVQTDSTAYLNDQSEKEVDLKEESEFDLNDKDKKTDAEKPNPYLWLVILLVSIFLIWMVFKYKPWIQSS